MGARPQEDIDAAAFEDHKLSTLAKRNQATADFVTAVRAARAARTEAGLDCSFTDDGVAQFSVQQGLKAACHTREDAAATLILQVLIIERLDKQRKVAWWIFGMLVVVLLKVF